LEAQLSELEVAAAHGSLRRHGRIHPGLEPVSDKKFFDGSRADYPTDGRPPANVDDHFSFPFPIVQDSHDYDKDYVKDENGDGGEWKAQSLYDKLRSGIGGAKAAAEKAKEDAVKEKNELDTKILAEKAAAAEAKKQEKKANEAAKEAAEAEAKAAAAKKAIDDSEIVVHKEVTDIEDCKKQLAEAKKRLEKLLGDHVTAQEAQAKADAAKAANERADASNAANANDHAKLQAEVARLSALVARGEAGLQKTEAELALAAKRLKGHRTADGEHSKGQDGGVYSSRAGRQMAPGTAAAMVLGLMWLQVIA
jgi:hypothetical protein